LRTNVELFVLFRGWWRILVSALKKLVHKNKDPGLKHMHSFEIVVLPRVNVPEVGQYNLSDSIVNIPIKRYKNE